VSPLDTPGRVVSVTTDGFITDLKDLGFRVLLTENFLLGKFKEISVVKPYPGRLKLGY
jgi:hypothetical protein